MSAEISAFRVKNWEKFQHYKNKDNPPPWIKLYADTLMDYEFMKLSEADRYKLIGVWLLASKSGNKVPNDSTHVARCIGVKRINLLALMAAGWLEPIYAESRLTLDVVYSQQSRTDTDTSAEQTDAFEFALDRLLAVLRDKDTKTEAVIRSLAVSLHLAPGDLEAAREAAEGPGVESPVRVAVSVLKKRKVGVA